MLEHCHISTNPVHCLHASSIRRFCSPTLGFYSCSHFSSTHTDNVGFTKSSYFILSLTCGFITGLVCCFLPLISAQVAYICQVVAITYLHHNHPDVPHYSGAAWSFTKGALGTVDRSFGFIGRHFFHNIIEHHVIHHLFPTIPFYHAAKATAAIRPLLGPTYRSQKEDSFLLSLWNTFRQCQSVEEAGNSGKYVWK